MARPSSSFDVGKTIGVLLTASLFLLTSCLDLSVDVRFESNTAGTVEVNALSYRMAQGLTYQTGNDVLAFPSSREEWVRTLATTPGVTISVFESSQEPLGLKTRAVLNFANARALETLFVLYKQKLTLLQNNQGLWTLTFDWQTPRLSAASKETKQLLSDLWGDVPWSITVLAPAPIQTLSIGEKIEPRKAAYRVRLGDFAADSPPAVWKVSW